MWFDPFSCFLRIEFLINNITKCQKQQQQQKDINNCLFYASFFSLK